MNNTDFICWFFGLEKWQVKRYEIIEKSLFPPPKGKDILHDCLRKFLDVWPLANLPLQTNTFS